MTEDREQQSPVIEKNKPLEISEPLVSLPDRRISVIGLEHGGFGPFPDRELAEREIERCFGGKFYF